MHWLRCRIDDKTRHGGAATTYTQPPEIYSITAGVDRRAGCPPTHASQISARSSASPTARRARSSRCATAPVLKPAVRRDARGPGPGVRRLGALGAARRLRRLDRVRPPLHARPRLGRDRVRPGDPRDRRRLDPVRRRAAEGRACCASPRYRHGGGRTGNVTARHADRCSRARSPGVDTVTNPDAGRRRRRRRAARARARARVDGDPHAATARSPPRTSSSWPARRQPARRARGLHPAGRGRRRCRCTSSRACTRPTASSPTTSWSPTRR